MTTFLLMLGSFGAGIWLTCFVLGKAAKRAGVDRDFLRLLNRIKRDG